MFAKLKIYCAEKGIETKEFWNSSYPLSDSLKEVLNKLHKDTLWKGSTKELYKRIVKLGLSTFSVRELKLLKKIVKDQTKSGKINFEELSYHLPGKSYESIKSKLIEIKMIKDPSRSKKRANVDAK